MKNDFSYINSETDHEQATQEVSERLENTRQQIKETSHELPGTLRKAAIRKTLPFVIGAGTVLLGTFLIRKWMQRPKTEPVIASQPTIPAPTSANITKAVVAQLLPFAAILVKTLLAKRRASASTHTE
jgi:hypothetical protein